MAHCNAPTKTGSPCQWPVVECPFESHARWRDKQAEQGYLKVRPLTDADAPVILRPMTEREKQAANRLNRKAKAKAKKRRPGPWSPNNFHTRRGGNRQVS